MKKRVLVLFSFALLIASDILAQDVKGKIVDKSTGGPLQGVTVNVKGTKFSTQSDASGNFSVNAQTSGTVILTVSSIGYKTVDIAASGANAGSIELEPITSSLSDVIVVGYGTVKKKDLTGSVVSVKGSEVRQVQSGNAMTSLQGKLPGVDVVTSTSTPGARPQVTIRGNRSITANNSPLYIVDGIQYNNFQDIDPNDIQSMDILKDASSTAIYGSRGANGVVIITTKKGVGRTKVSLGAYYGGNEVAGYPVPMSGPQYVDLKREAYRTAGRWSSPADDKSIFTNTLDSAAIADGASYYYPGYLITNGSQQNYSINVAAGTDKTKVFFSYGFFGQKGLLSNDYSNRNTVRLNIDQYLTSNLRIGLQSQFTHYSENLRSDGVMNVANKVIPIYSPYNPDGSLAQFPGGTNQFNPMFDDIEGNYVNDNDISRILTSVYLNWAITKDLNFRSNLGITKANSQNGYFSSALTIPRSTSSGSLSSIANVNGTDVNWDNILTYQKAFGKHNLEVTALTSYLKSTVESSSASGTGQLLANQSFYALQNNPTNIAVASNYVSSTLLSGAFRVNYNYLGKYLLTVTGREDGSSILAEGNKWQFFPSVAAAWRISDENFMQKTAVISDLKLRGSYGVAGNSAVAPYSSQSNLALVPFGWNDAPSLAYALSPLTANPDLKWETTATLDFGFDFGLWKQRVSGSFDWYNQTTSNLLLQRALPPTTGVSRVTQNIGETANKGFEIGIQTVNIQNKELTWTSGFSFTKNNEKIVSLVGGQDDVANGWFIGSPVSAFFDYEKIGIWQTADSSQAASYGRKPGEIRVADINGDKQITAADRTILGSAVPNYIFGFNNELKYKGFDLNVYLYARQGQMFVSQYALKFEPNAIENSANVDYWTPENPTNSYPRPNVNISRTAMPFASTLGYVDGSFLKIRNVTLGYNLSAKFMDKLHITKMRFYMSLQNYFTFSKVKDYDPEGAGSFERPLSKLILGGINIDF